MSTVLKPFEYFSPTSIQEAVSLLNQYNEKARIVAGGTDLVVLLRARALSPDYIIDISNIKELDYIKDEGASLRIGPLTTMRSLEKSSLVLAKAPILAKAANLMAITQIRNRGTIGGNLCNASPSADTAPPLIALAANFKIASSEGERVVASEEFFLDVNKTVLKSNELLTEVQVPQQENGVGASFMKLGMKPHLISIVNVATVVAMNGNTCKNIRLVLGSIAPTPTRAKKAEAYLTGKTVDENAIREVSKIASEEGSPISDVRASEEYRKEISNVLVRRAVQEAVKGAGGG